MPVSTKDMLLFLLSSVLVSSDASSIPKMHFRSRDGEEEDVAEIEVAGTVNSEEGPVSNVPSQTLDCKWTLWYEKKSDEKKSKCLNKSDYLKELKKAASFQTIPSFWSCWNEVQQICSMPTESVNYHLFKDNIKPIWEDPKNIKGGKWSFVLPTSTSRQDVMKNWMSLMLTVLIGELGELSEINGAVLSVRSWGSMFSVWNRNANNKQLIDSVAEKLKEMFGITAVKYQRHQVRVMRNNAERVKMTRAKKTYSSDESISSNSDTSSSEGEQDKPIRPMRRSAVNEVPRSRSTSTDLSDAEMKAVLDSIQNQSEVKKPEVVPVQTEAIQTSKFEQQPEVVASQSPSTPSIMVEDEDNRRKKFVNNVTKKEPQYEIRNKERLQPQQQQRTRSQELTIPNKESFPISPIGVALVLVIGVATSLLSWSLYL